MWSRSSDTKTYLINGQFIRCKLGPSWRRSYWHASKRWDSEEELPIDKRAIIIENTSEKTRKWSRKIEYT